MYIISVFSSTSYFLLVGKRLFNSMQGVNYIFPSRPFASLATQWQGLHIQQCSTKAFLLLVLRGQTPELRGSVLHWSAVSYELVHSLSSLLMQGVKGPLTGLSCLFVFGLSCPSLILEFISYRARCSHRDRFVILVVTLLLNVVFTNSTIYGQKNDLECVIVLGSFGGRWPFCNSSLT